MKKDHTSLIVISSILLIGIMIIFLFLFVRWQVRDAASTEARKVSEQKDPIIAVIAAGYEQLRKDYELRSNTTIPSAEAIITAVAGETGAQGIQGFPGETGIQGLQGLQGLQGIQGIPGLVGALGQPGLQGTQGETGNTGQSGSSGAQGPGGPAGPQGEQGPIGPRGPDGPAGPECSPGYHKEVVMFVVPPMTAEMCVQNAQSQRAILARGGIQ